MTYDQSHDGAGNGSGGRFMDSTAQVLDAAQRRYAAETKAASDPMSLTDADLNELTSDTLTRLMDCGALGHLGIGRRSKPRRTR